uniref:Uncharacterized protein n=1 Tax=CRESS virus SC_1_H1_2017 TaxID=2723249 RepID=A0A6H0X6P9_9VIRU|nr:hypothetical protein [CRESS virus SC_1_H1_2017]
MKKCSFRNLKLLRSQQTLILLFCPAIRNLPHVKITPICRDLTEQANNKLVRVQRDHICFIDLRPPVKQITIAVAVKRNLYTCQIIVQLAFQSLIVNLDTSGTVRLSQVLCIIFFAHVKLCILPFILKQLHIRARHRHITSQIPPLYMHM